MNWNANSMIRRWKFMKAPRSTPTFSDNDSLRWCVYQLRALAQLAPKPHRVFAISQRRFRDCIVRCRGVHSAITSLAATYYDTYLISMGPILIETCCPAHQMACSMIGSRAMDDGDLRHGWCESGGRTTGKRSVKVRGRLYVNHQQRPLRGEA